MKIIPFLDFPIVWKVLGRTYIVYSGYLNIPFIAGYICLEVLFYLMTLLDEILSSQSDDMMLKGDIIRVLTICMGALWIDELYPEVNVFRRALGDSPVSNREVDKALEDLVEAGFIDVSPRIKAGERAEGIKSKLVKLVNFHEIAGRVLRDERVSRYRALLRFR